LGTEGSYKKQSVLETVVIALNTRAGRRSRDLELPPCWPRDGVCKLDTNPEDRTVELMHKFMLDATKEPTQRMLPDTLTKLIKHFSQLQLLQNYSERNAILIERGGVLRVNLATIFPEVAAGSSLESVGHEVLPSLSPPSTDAHVEGAEQEVNLKKAEEHEEDLKTEQNEQGEVEGDKTAKADEQEESVFVFTREELGDTEDLMSVPPPPGILAGV
jgi:hypothetical protein